MSRKIKNLSRDAVIWEANFLYVPYVKDISAVVAAGNQYHDLASV